MSWCRSYNVGRIKSFIGRVDNDEIPGVAMFHIDHAVTRMPGIADDHPSRLEHQRATEIMRHPLTIAA